MELNNNENSVLEQYVGDNIDINVRSLYGNSSIHAMGRRRITSLEPEDVEQDVFPRKTINISQKSEILDALEIKCLVCISNSLTE